jgi:CHRD domain
MRKPVFVFAFLAVAALLTVTAVALANLGRGEPRNVFKANLNGYNEVVGGPGASSIGSVSTTGHGRLRVRIFDDHIHYVLDYSDMSGGTVTASHLHFAQQHVGGGVSAFLCGGGDKPACTTPSGHFEADIDAADVIGPADQGIAAGELNELKAAIRAGAVYANVHASSFPEGEIRGQLGKGHGHGQGRPGNDPRRR